MIAMIAVITSPEMATRYSSFFLFKKWLATERALWGVIIAISVIIGSAGQ